MNFFGVCRSFMEFLIDGGSKNRFWNAAGAIYPQIWVVNPTVKVFKIVPDLAHSKHTELRRTAAIWGFAGNRQSFSSSTDLLIPALPTAACCTSQTAPSSRATHLRSRNAL